MARCRFFTARCGYFTACWTIELKIAKLLDPKKLKQFQMVCVFKSAIKINLSHVLNYHPHALTQKTEFKEENLARQITNGLPVLLSNYFPQFALWQSCNYDCPRATLL
jgi:hypothetical protein